MIKKLLFEDTTLGGDRYLRIKYCGKRLPRELSEFDAHPCGSDRGKEIRWNLQKTTLIRTARKLLKKNGCDVSLVLVNGWYHSTHPALGAVLRQ